MQVILVETRNDKMVVMLVLVVAHCFLLVMYDGEVKPEIECEVPQRRSKHRALIQ